VDEQATIRPSGLLFIVGECNSDVALVESALGVGLLCVDSADLTACRVGKNLRMRASSSE